MLILTRRVGESIVIGDDVVITVVEASRDQVRIGIDAPRSVPVHREEVYRAITEENEAARRADVGAFVDMKRPVTAAAAPRRPRKP